MCIRDSSLPPSLPPAAATMAARAVTTAGHAIGSSLHGVSCSAKRGTELEDMLLRISCALCGTEVAYAPRAWRGVAFWRRAVPLYIRYRLAEKVLGSRVQGLGPGSRVQGPGSRVWDLGSRLRV
eukprot:2120396-Rhodomonas_salina.1